MKIHSLVDERLNLLASILTLRTLSHPACIRFIVSTLCISMILKPNQWPSPANSTIPLVSPLTRNMQKFFCWGHKVYFTYESPYCSQNLLISSTLSCHSLNACKLFCWRKPETMVVFRRRNPALRLLLEMLASSFHLASYETTFGHNLPGFHFLPQVKLRGCAKWFLSFLPILAFNYFFQTVLMSSGVFHLSECSGWMTCWWKLVENFGLQSVQHNISLLFS